MTFQVIHFSIFFVSLKFSNCARRAENIFVKTDWNHDAICYIYFFRPNALRGWENATFKLQPCLLRKLANRHGNLKTALCGAVDSASFSDLWEPREGRRRVKRFSSGFYTHICITFISTAVLWNILAHQFLDAVGYARQISCLDKNNRRSYFSGSSKYFTTDVSRSRQETRLHGYSESLNQEDKVLACSLFTREP